MTEAKTNKCVCGFEAKLRTLRGHQTYCRQHRDWLKTIAADTALLEKIRPMQGTELEAEAYRLGTSSKTLRQMIKGTWSDQCKQPGPKPSRPEHPIKPLNLPSLDASGEEILLALRGMLDAYKARGKEIIRLNERIAILEAQLKEKNDLTAARYSARIDNEIIRQGKE